MCGPWPPLFLCIRALQAPVDGPKELVFQLLSVAPNGQGTLLTLAGRLGAMQLHGQLCAPKLCGSERAFDQRLKAKQHDAGVSWRFCATAEHTAEDYARLKEVGVLRASLRNRNRVEMQEIVLWELFGGHVGTGFRAKRALFREIA